MPDLDPFVIRRAQTTDGETHIVAMELAGDRPPRYGEKTPPFHVGRGPVPRHRSRHPTLAGETRLDARVASEAPALR